MVFVAYSSRPAAEKNFNHNRLLHAPSRHEVKLGLVGTLKFRFLMCGDNVYEKVRTLKVFKYVPVCRRSRFTFLVVSRTF